MPDIRDALAALDAALAAEREAQDLANFRTSARRDAERAVAGIMLATTGYGGNSETLRPMFVLGRDRSLCMIEGHRLPTNGQWTVIVRRFPAEAVISG